VFPDKNLISRVGLVFFGTGVLLLTAELLLGAGRLTLNGLGFEVRHWLRRRQYRWPDVAEFDVWERRSVVFNEPARADMGADMNMIFARHTSWLPDTYGFDPADLARLMNFWRAEALEPAWTRASVMPPLRGGPLAASTGVSAVRRQTADATPAVWFCETDDNSAGPLTLRELRATLARQPVPAHVKVWRTGLPGWKNAGEVAELAELVANPAPKAKAPHDVPKSGQPHSPEAPTGRNRQSEFQKDMTWLAIRAGSYVVFIAIMAALSALGIDPRFAFLVVALAGFAFAIWYALVFLRAPAPQTKSMRGRR
jgi:hypothetical protein